MEVRDLFRLGLEDRIIYISCIGFGLMDGIQIGKRVLGIWFRPGLFAGLNKQKKEMRRNDENDLMG